MGHKQCRTDNKWMKMMDEDDAMQALLHLLNYLTFFASWKIFRKLTFDYLRIDLKRLFFWYYMIYS